MELFSMLAKLTLDASEFEKQLKAAESEAQGMSVEEAKLTLDVDDFTGGISEAQDAADSFTPPDEEHALDMDESDFTEGVEDAQEASDDFTPPEEENELNLDASDFTSELGTAQAESETFGSVVGQVFENLKGVLVTTGIVSLVGQFVGFLKQGVALAGQNGDAIDKQSQKLHLSAQAYQEWNYALGLSGASVADLTRAMRTFDEIQGGKITEDQAKYFEQLGISATDASGKMKSAQELMEETVYALADYQGNDRGLITEAFFGKNSAGLNALLNSTSDEIKAMKQEANDLGLIMSDEDVKNAAAYTDATSRLQQSVEALKTALGETLLPMLTSAADKLAVIVAFFNPRTRKNSLSDEFSEIDDQLSTNLIDIEATAGAAEKMIDKLFSMGDATKLTAEQQAEWKATAEWLKDNIPSLSDVIDTDTMSISKNKDEVIALTKEWKNYAIERAKADALKAKQEALAKKTTEWLEAEAEAVKLEGEEEKARLKVLEIAKRDFLNMPENKQSELASRLKYGSVDELLASEKGLQGVANLLGPNYTEQGWSSFGSKELNQAVAEYDSTMSSAVMQTKEARQRADELKEEVENGRQELAEFDATLDIVIGNLSETGDEAEGATSDVKGLNDELGKIPSYVKTTIDAVVNWTYNNGPTLLKKAIGDAYIPFDMPIFAHRGERILTATEERKRSSGDIDYGTLRSEIIGAMREGMSGATVRSYLNGSDITDDVDRNMIRKLKARRFAT